MNAWSCCALVLTAVLASAPAHADEGHFYVYVANTTAPKQPVVESGWREGQKLRSLVSSEEGKKRIGGVYPRLFGQTQPVEKPVIEGNLKAAKAAYLASDFDLAETHFARAMDAVYASPETLSGSSMLTARLADTAVQRYTNALARRQPEAAARKQLEGFIARFPSLAPTPTDHAPDVLAVFAESKKSVLGVTGLLSVNVLPLELERGGSCRLFLNGLDVMQLPMSTQMAVPVGEHYLQVRCAGQHSWIQIVNLGTGTTALKVPVRAMGATRADIPTGGLVVVAPAEGDTSALVEAVSTAAGFLGAMTVTESPPEKVDFGLLGSGTKMPIKVAQGTATQGGIENVRTANDKLPPKEKSLSPWPFVVLGAGVATLAGGAYANKVYLDDRDNGDQDLDSAPSIALYAVGGALAVGGVVWLVLELTDDGDGGAALAPGGPGSVIVHF